MALKSTTGPTFWDHLYFWLKELVIFVGLVALITSSFVAFFFLPDGHLTSEFLTLLFY